MIELLKIKNFRNLESCEYRLSDLNIFMGKNAHGKTNVLNAAYWLLTDSLLDGSADFQSIKPIGNEKAVVSVEATFSNGHILKKEYKEKWTRARGAAEAVLAGHDTTYFLDGVKIPVKEAKAKISKLFGIENAGGKFDLLKASINPYYFVQGTEWKELRRFITTAIGDCKEEETAIAKDLGIEAELAMYGYEVDAAKKGLSRQAKDKKAAVERVEGMIAGLEQLARPSEKDVEDARRILNETNTGDSTRVQAAMEKLAECRKKDEEKARQNAEKQNALIAEKNGIAAQIAAENAKRREINDSLTSKRREKFNLEMDGMRIKTELDTANEALANTRDEYRRIAREQAPEAKKCQNCGVILNSDELDQFDTRKEERTAECVKRGKEAKERVDTLKVSLQNNGMKVQGKANEIAGLETTLNELNSAISDLESKVNDVLSRMNSVGSGVESEETRAALRELAAAREETSRKENGEAKAMASNVLDALSAYNGAQSKIKDLSLVLEKERNALVSLEEKVILMGEFMKRKIEVIKRKVKDVFGNLEFEMIEANIKADSYDEVCYPLILGKKTPFKDGSGAEKIMTGLYFISKARQHLGIDMNGLPVVFDEVDKLDSERMSGLMEYGMQILTSKVADCELKLETKGR